MGRPVPVLQAIFGTAICLYFCQGPGVCLHDTASKPGTGLTVQFPRFNPVLTYLSSQAPALMLVAWGRF
jgi:hypothetical protein